MKTESVCEHGNFSYLCSAVEKLLLVYKVKGKIIQVLD